MAILDGHNAEWCGCKTAFVSVPLHSRTVLIAKLPWSDQNISYNTLYTVALGCQVGRELILWVILNWLVHLSITQTKEPLLGIKAPTETNTQTKPFAPTWHFSRNVIFTWPATVTFDIMFCFLLNRTKMIQEKWKTYFPTPNIWLVNHQEGGWSKKSFIKCGSWILYEKKRVN